MKPASILKKTMLVGALTAAVAGFSASVFADAPAQEKCYGVVKAGKNDCKAVANSCAGQTTRNGEGFVAVPKGLCEKLVGGSLTPTKS